MDGGQGMLAMQQACHNLVPGSHVCKDTEIALSPYNSSAQNLEGYAWVIFETGSYSLSVEKFKMISPLSLNSFSGDDGYYDQGENASQSCYGWSNPGFSSYGTIVSDNLNFVLSRCDLQRKVACCK